MSNPSGFLAGKKLLITGVLSNRSIAYGIARACRNQGAELAFSYVGERFKDRITEFAAEFGSVLDYFEQPCRTTTELAELRYRLGDDDVDVRIAVDEGLRRARDLYADNLAASLRSAGDVLIVKVAPVGGVARAPAPSRPALGRESSSSAGRGSD